MRKYLIVWAIALGALIAASLSSRAWVVQKPAAAPPSYVGPCDVVNGSTCNATTAQSTFAVWGGFRAYSAFTIGTNAVQFERASDSTTQNFATQSTGFLDESAITAFCGAANANGCYPLTIYDQTGNGKNWTIFGTSPSFSIRQNSLNSHTCGTSTGTTQGLQTAGMGVSSPSSSTMVVSHINNTSNTIEYFVTSFNGLEWLASFDGTSNFYFLNPSNLPLGVTGLTSNPFAVVLVAQTGGATTTLDANGSAATTTSNTTSLNATNDGWRLINLGASTTFDFCEMGVAAAALSSGQIAVLEANERSATNGWNF